MHKWVLDTHGYPLGLLERIDTPVAASDGYKDKPIKHMVFGSQCWDNPYISSTCSSLVMDFDFLLSEHVENSKSSWIKIHMAYSSILDTAVCLLAWDLFAAYLHVSQIIWHNLTHAHPCTHHLVKGTFFKVQSVQSLPLVKPKPRSPQLNHTKS